MIKVRNETINTSSTSFQEVKDEWWTLLSDDEIAQAAWLKREAIQLYQNTKMQDFFNFAAMYGSKGLGYSSLNTYNSWTQQGRSITSNNSRLKLNAAKACVDTAQAKIAKNKPRPFFLTTGGDYSQQRKSELLTQYMDGLFDENNTYQIAQDVFKDACIFGTGVLHFYTTLDGKVKNEKVWIEEITVDEIEAQYKKPLSLFRSKLVHREELLKLYPKKEELIKAAAPVEYQLADTKDMIAVQYSWHLNGKYVVHIKEGALLTEDYPKDYFPFAFFRWQEGLRGFYGQGIVEQIFSTQLEINQLCATIQQSIYFASVPRVFLSNESKVISQHLDNRVGAIVKYQGSKAPVFSTPTAQNAEVYNYLDYLWKKAFEQVGLSEMSATSAKPAGLDAGVAIREYADIESQRFAIIGQNWEQFFMDIANVIVDLSKDLYESGNKNLKVKVRKGSIVEEIKWKDVASKADEYVLRCFPTSILPSTPAGKLQMVQELIQGGFVSKEEGLSLLDFPDLKSIISLKNAAVDGIQKTFQNILEETKYSSPEPFSNLNLGVQMGQGQYLKARNENVDEEKLELMRRYIEDCYDLMQVQPPTPVEATNVAPVNPTPEGTI